MTMDPKPPMRRKGHSGALVLTIRRVLTFGRSSSSGSGLMAESCLKKSKQRADQTKQTTFHFVSVCIAVYLERLLRRRLSLRLEETLDIPTTAPMAAPASSKWSMEKESSLMILETLIFLSTARLEFLRPCQVCKL